MRHGTLKKEKSCSSSYMHQSRMIIGNMKNSNILEGA